MTTPDTTPPRIPDLAPAIGAGRYHLLQKLGEGGMASVYRAWDGHLQRRCAVKVLLPEFARKAKIRKRFENEATLIARIDHRHVIRVYDVGTTDALPWIAMELAEGGSLDAWTARYGAMPPRMAVDVMMQVCKGIGAAHDLGVVHRDIKPHNVLITHRGVCKVTDFGIARLDDANLTRTGSVLGTLGFMAPEQRTDSASVDVRADVYSIAATLYNLVTNQSIADLFLAEHDASLLDGVPEPLAAVILKATAYRPEDRFDDVAQLAKALFQVRSALPANPEDTPRLPLPADVSAVPEIDVTTFAEIEPLLENSTFADTPGPRVLPYFMPTREQASSEELPSWLDPSEVDAAHQRDASAPTPAPAPVVAPSSPEGGEANPGDRSEDPERLHALAELRDFVFTIVSAALKLVWKPLSALSLPLGGLALVLTIMLISPTLALRSAEAEALEARSAVYQALEDERRIIDDLAALGASRESLEVYWADVARLTQEPERYDATARFVRQLEQQMRVVGGSRGSGPLSQRAEQARMRYNRIAMRMTAYEQALGAWEEVSQDTRARLAVRLGLARSP